MTDKKEVMEKCTMCGNIQVRYSSAECSNCGCYSDFVIVKDRDTDVNDSSGAGSADSPAVSPSKQDDEVRE